MAFCYSSCVKGDSSSHSHLAYWKTFEMFLYVVTYYITMMTLLNCYNYSAGNSRSLCEPCSVCLGGIMKMKKLKLRE